MYYAWDDSFDLFDTGHTSQQSFKFFHHSVLAFDFSLLVFHRVG